MEPHTVHVVRRRKWVVSVEPFFCRYCGRMMDSNAPRHGPRCRLPGLIRAMVADGCTVTDICERTGLTKTSVWARLSRMGLRVSEDG